MRQRLSENRFGAQSVRDKKAVPKEEMRTKHFNLTVKCAADFVHRITEHENLVNELLNMKLYAKMNPTNIYRGDFEVMEGFEGMFKAIAKQYGFNATEVMECL